MAGINAQSEPSVNFLRDYSTYIVGIPTFIISTFAAYYFYRKQVNKKELSYSIENAISIVDIQNTYRNRFKVLFDEKPINDLSLLTIKFFNSGNQPITNSDYEEDIKIELTQGINKNIYVVSADITDKLPSNISNKLSTKGTELYITPSLLNPKDKFRVQILVDFEDVDEIKINITSRISGVSNLNYVDSKEKTPLESLLSSNLIKLIATSAIAAASSGALLSRLAELLSPFFKR
jgi:hypothetical protein